MGGLAMANSSRGVVLTVCAVLFALLALSNFLKPFHMSPNVGFVFFGMKTHGLANAVLGPAFGLLLLLYAFGILQMRRWALPIAIAYAAYVIINLSLYSIRNIGSPGQPSPAFMLGYIVVAVGVSVGSALLLYRRREMLA
jgi:hypothetical protein